MTYLYFHSPCFDGIASAVLAVDLLEGDRGWSPVSLRAVNYDRRVSWLATPLPERSAVVDFLYHPAASFWADHHQTSFLDESARRHFEARRGANIIYDEQAPSCAGLLLAVFSTVPSLRSERHAELAKWADTIDSAGYASVEDAIRPSTPALRINLSLVIEASEEFCVGLVQGLRGRSLAAVADTDAVRDRCARADTLIERGLDRFKRNSWIEDDGIVVFDVETADTIVSRYAPYYFYPQARYSIGVTRSLQGAKITAMRNPWRHFESVPLGHIAEGLGGGGHQRVGSIVVPLNRAGAIRDRFLSELRSAVLKSGSG